MSAAGEVHAEPKARRARRGAIAGRPTRKRSHGVVVQGGRGMSPGRQGLTRRDCGEARA